MSSTIEIHKICSWCGKEFIARKCSTKYCCKRCSEHAYKAAKRKEHVARCNDETVIAEKEKQTGNNEYMTPRQCATLLGLCVRTVYYHLEANLIPCVRLRGKTLISRSSIEKMFENAPEYTKREKKEVAPIENFYTTKEILDKFGISNSWLFKMAKERNIPKTVVRGKTLWSRKHIDKALADKEPSGINGDEWYSVEDISSKYNLTKEAVYRLTSEMRIKKLKEKCRVFYSRRQIDRAMGNNTNLEPEYYTMPEAMTRYNMTRDQISHYVRTNNIPRTYKGKYVRIDKKALDELFAPPKIC